MIELFDKIWKENKVYLDTSLEFALDLEDEECAIILSTNYQNYERYIALEYFKNLFSKTSLRLDIYNIQCVQVCILNLIKKSFIDKDNIQSCLRILNKINDNKIIIDFLESIEVKKNNKNYNVNLNKLNDINFKLQELSQDEKIKENLKKAHDKFNLFKFNIAITGIMNAGKSSLLNALLKNDLLGVSNIPETANLTIINYGENEFAKVYFWSKQEWIDISRLDEKSKNIDYSFLKDYDTIKDIPLKDLKDYTSAKSEISSLIKKVEINAKLDFLKNNICIVDTPGLDDVIRQRELITSEYLSNSDFIIHLMNSTCALSQKDLEFLLNILINSRINKILILLTKSDLLSENDLEDVISYTKKTLILKLKEYSLDEIYINNIDFLCVSSKKALDFYKKLANEEDFKKSNIPSLEKYLLDKFYGGNKAQLMCLSYKKELKLELLKIIKEYEFKNKIIKNNSEDLNKENKELFKKINKEKELLVKVKNDINEAIQELSLNKDLLFSLLNTLKNKLKDKILDELIYYKDKKEKIDKTRFFIIIDTTLKDGFIDILRDIKFDYLKKMEIIRENLCLKYEFLKEKLDLNFKNFIEKTSFAIDDILNSTSYEDLKIKLKDQISVIKDISKFQVNLDDFLSNAFFEFNLENIVLNLGLNIDFLNFLQNILKDYELEQAKNIKLLDEIIKTNNLDELLKIYDDNLKTISLLKSIEMDLDNAD